MTDYLPGLTGDFTHTASTQRDSAHDEASDAYRWNGGAIAQPLDAVLFHKGKPIGHGRIIAVGPHGMRMATEIETDEKYYLQVRFTLMEDGQDVQYGLFGRVVHRDDAEIGLLMDVLDPNTRDGLQALLEVCQEEVESAVSH